MKNCTKKVYIKIFTNMQQERKFAQICSLNINFHKYAAWIKCAQICSQNKSLHKYAARMEIFKNMQPESKMFWSLEINVITKFCPYCCISNRCRDNQIPKFCLLRSIPNRFWEKCKFKFFKFLNFFKFSKMFCFDHWQYNYVIPKFYPFSL